MKAKIWLGVGLASVIPLAGAAGHQTRLMAAAAQPQTAATGRDTCVADRPHPAPCDRVQGGEQGEGRIDLLYGAAPEAALMTQLRLIRGHLHVGCELVRAGLFDDSLAHFHHPIEEIYATVEAELEARGVPLRAELEALTRAAAARQGGEAFVAAYDAAVAAVARAEETIPKSERMSLGLNLDVAVRLLRQAMVEYRDAFVDGELANVIEYQDARGFVWQASELFEAAAAQLKQRDAKVFADVELTLAELRKAWPSALPPDRIVKSYVAVRGLISLIEYKTLGFR